MRHIFKARWTRVWHYAAMGAALAACDGLLDADLPHLLTDAAIQSQSTAETQVNSAIALFECGYSAFGLMALGHEDVMETVAGAGQQHSYFATPGAGNCDGSSASITWFGAMMGARSMLSNDPAKLVSTAVGNGRGVYDRINEEWALGLPGERLSAIAAIYTAATLAHLGEFVCEASLDGSDLITPTEMLVLAESWTGRALTHINNVGDFAMPFGVAPSARDMATAVRARIRWANRDFGGAATDAAAVLASNGEFTAWVTREGGETRRNKIFHAATDIGFSGGLGVNTWWTPHLRSPNPATGEIWPNPIPHTGYIFLGIMPDGRALETGNVPVRYAEETRDGDRNPIPLNNGAVPDTRVVTVFKSIQGPQPRETPGRYSSDADDIPYMTWEELRLIIADRELAQGNLTGAIDQVNQIRSAADLPVISGAYLASLQGSPEQVRHMLLEERRREFFAEGGRYWSTKIQNTDVLWFPRNEGASPSGYNLQGGVRMTMPTNEYNVNSYFVDRGGLTVRATGCSDLFGSQAPVVN